MFESVREVYMIGPRVHYGPGSGPGSGPVVRVPVASGVVGGAPGQPWRGGSGAPARMPLVLATVDAKSRRVAARAVVDCGNGLVVGGLGLLCRDWLIGW